MAHDGDATVVSIESRPRRRSASPRRLVGLMIGIVAGLGIGQLFFGLSENSIGPEMIGLEVFPALPGNAEGSLRRTSLDLVGIEVAENGEYQFVSGSLDGLLTETPLRTGEWDAVSVDRSGKWLAVGEHSPDGQGLLLVGSASNLTPLSATMTSFAWHDSRSGMLSFTEQISESEWQLKVAEMGGGTRVIVGGDELGGEVTAWGDWGWAIQTSAESITFLDESGQEWEKAGGLALDSHHTGWLLTVHPAGLNIVVPGGGVVYLEIDHEAIGGVGAASFSPDRKKVILIGPRGVKITDINGERPAITIPLSSLPRDTAWSPESRYALIAQRGGIMVVDTTGGEAPISYGWQGKPLLALVARQ